MDTDVCFNTCSRQSNVFLYDLSQCYHLLCVLCECIWDINTLCWTWDYTINHTPISKYTDNITNGGNWIEEKWTRRPWNKQFQFLSPSGNQRVRVRNVTHDVMNTETLWCPRTCPSLSFKTCAFTWTEPAIEIDWYLCYFTCYFKVVDSAQYNMRLW